MSATYTHSRPLYWSVYERAYELDGDVWDDRNITLEEWERNFDWVAKELLPYGYDMVCTDGFLPPKCDGGQPYMTRLGQVPLKETLSRQQRVVGYAWVFMIRHWKLGVILPH